MGREGVARTDAVRLPTLGGKEDNQSAHDPERSLPIRGSEPERVRCSRRVSHTRGQIRTRGAAANARHSWLLKQVASRGIENRLIGRVGD